MAPFVISAAVLLSGAAWSVRLIMAPDVFSVDAGSLLGLDLLVMSAIAALGILLSRGKWARLAAFAVVSAQLVLAVVMEQGVWSAVTITASIVAIGLLSGPWLGRWLRRLPPADAAPVPAIFLSMGLLAVPALAAVTDPRGPGPWHWALAGLAFVTGWAYARAMHSGLWSARLLIPLLGVAAAFDSHLIGAAALIAGTVAVSILAWTPSARIAVTTLTPISAPGVAVPPELVPSDMLHAAGYDARGRPLESQ